MFSSSKVATDNDGLIENMEEQQLPNMKKSSPNSPFSYSGSLRGKGDHNNILHYWDTLMTIFIYIFAYK